jgi:hypothetical protein
MESDDIRGRRVSGILLLCLAALAACAAEAPPTKTTVPAAVNLESVVEAALADAMRRTGLARDAIRVLGAEAVTWPDGSLGCPEPGMMYTQALVPGYRVRLEARGAVLDYHASARGQPSLCPPDRAREPLPDAAR